MANAIRFATPPPLPTTELKYGIDIPFLGLNVRDVEMKIAPGQSPAMQNVNLDDRGSIAKRRGQEYLLPASKGAGGINGYYKELFNGKHIYAWGTGLYSFDGTTEATLATGLTNAKGYFYIVNDILYYKNGTDFIQITSLFAASAVGPSAYVPIILINKAPDGTGGDVNEEINLIQPGFEEWFIGTVSDVDYHLSLIDLDATEITAQKYATGTWTDLVEDTDFTVVRATGIVTFSIAPGDGSGINNVKIRAYKTNAGFADRIKKCPYSELYGGGTNDSRVFTAGNPDYKNMYWFTGLTGNTDGDPLYWPENNFNRIGSDIKYIYGWSKLYTKLLALKEDGIYNLTYNSSGIAFTASIVNARIGCDMPDSIQIINNLPVFCNTKSGLWTIVSTLEATEKNVMPLSDLVNGTTYRKGILSESVSDLQNCSSYDDGKKYYLCVGSKVWVWDYTLSPYAGDQNSLIWFYYTNINAANWAYINNEAHYGDRTIGQLVKFHNDSSDFGLAIDAFYYTNMTDFGQPNNLKTFTDIWYSTKPAGHSDTQISYSTEKGENIAELVPVSVSTFDWTLYDWGNFTWDVQRFPSKVHRKPKLKNIQTLQVKFSNNVIDQDLSVLDITLKATIGQKNK
jgi:hypothetical protein